MGCLTIKCLTHEAFSKYGRILLPNEEDKRKNLGDRFYVLDHAESEGWRMAYLEDTARERNMLSNHPNTKETFEPLEGVAVIVVAPHDSPSSVEAFL